MVHREKHKMAKTKKSDFEEEEDSTTPSNSKSNFVSSNSDDDAEANEDLSLKIVRKAMSRASFQANRDGEDGVVDGESEVGDGSEDFVMTELVALDSGKKTIKKDKKKKKKTKRIEIEAQTVNVVPLPEGQDTETIKGLEAVNLSEQDHVDKSDNAVLRRLLRGPRYFDPPDSSWGTCYNCGEEGHSAVNCKSAKRKKPCFICGSFEHGAKKCQKGKDCFICSQSGHRAKDCPKKFKRCSQGSDSCLKCGSSWHDMSSCNNYYSPEDLKEIQCYVCKSFGHLCCANYFGTMASKVSCYKCGQLGHTGLACRGSHGETAGEATPSSCFKCGQEGHFARECSNSVKIKKRSHDLSTPKRKASKENNAYKGHNSAPQDISKAHKKKKLQFDEENTASSSRWKAWGGWNMDDPGDFPRGTSHHTQVDKDYWSPNPTFGRHASTSRSARKFDSPYGRTSNSQWSRNSFQHGHSVSSFSSPNSGYKSNTHTYF